MELSRTDIKLSFKKPKFSVSRTNKTVSCRLDFDIVAPYDYDKNMTLVPDGHSSVTAVAVCHKQDVFNVEIGKRISSAKAENMAYEKALKLFYDFDPIDETDVLIHNLVKDFAKKTKRCKNHNIGYINYITK